jgi:hypothetical protein
MARKAERPGWPAGALRSLDFPLKSDTTAGPNELQAAALVRRFAPAVARLTAQLAYGEASS